VQQAAGRRSLTTGGLMVYQLKWRNVGFHGYEIQSLYYYCYNRPVAVSCITLLVGY